MFLSKLEKKYCNSAKNGISVVLSKDSFDPKQPYVIFVITRSPFLFSYLSYVFISSKSWWLHNWYLLVFAVNLIYFYSNGIPIQDAPSVILHYIV